MSGAQTLSRVRRRNEDRFVTLGLVASLLLHVFVLPGLINSSTNGRRQLSPSIEVSFEPAQGEVRPQIVSPPELKESPIEPETSRLSDKNFATEHETIKRGMPAGGDPNPPAPKVEPQPPAEKQRAPEKNPVKEKPARVAPSDAEVTTNEERIALKTATLRLSKDALVDTFGKEAKRTSSDTRASPQPFSREPGAGAAFFGSGGTPDYLPSLPDGDMTMLNAKASKYATFVRRVAVQVFAALRTQGWESLSGREINAAGGSTYARAILSPKGELLSVNIITRSGSGGFDAVVASSIKTGARDPNPPADAAAEDGTYRFVFEARSWAVRASDPRTGAPSERRWLMLGTGLE